MAAPRNKGPRFKAGFVKRDGPLASQGRYVDGHWVRFVRGEPEKMKGWEQWSTGDAFAGIARGAHTWNDLTYATQAAFGTNSKLYYVDLAREFINITPYVSPAGTALTDKLSTTDTSTTVEVEHTGHGAVVGQTVTIAATVGGITLAGDYVISSVEDANTYTIEAATAATSTVVSGGGAVTVYYEIAPGTVDPAGGFGYGVGGYGEGTYGTPRDTTNIYFEPGHWSLDNFGKLLLAAPHEGCLYVFDPTVAIVRAVKAAAVEGPGSMHYVFVTPERYVVALGASPDTGTTSDPMLLRWSTQADYTVWTPAVDNTANARRLGVGKKLVAGTATGSQLNLLWTDSALYLMQFTGSSFVFDTRIAGVNCGLIGPFAFAMSGPVAYWMSQSAFYLYDGSVRRIPNSDDIAEWVFSQQRLYYGTKNVAFYNERFNEVWFLFVPDGDSEPTTYAVVNLNDFSWVTGMLTRTAAMSMGGADTRPILACTNGHLYIHETGLDGYCYDGVNGVLPIDAWIEAAPTQIGEGDEDIEIIGVNGDWGRITGDVTVEFTCYDGSGETAIDSGTVTMVAGTATEDLRICGRLISFIMRSNTLGGDFRAGNFSFTLKTSGGR